MKKKKKKNIYCKGKYSRGEIFLRGNIPAGKYSCGFGDFFFKLAGFSPQEYFPATVDFCKSQSVDKESKKYLCFY